MSIDRLAMRARPPGEPVMHQNWSNLLFLHWPVDPALLRPLIPEALDIDTFEGTAWIGITPFHVADARPQNLPAFPLLSSFHELNVRTYVLHQGVPGVWFFSLDVSKLLPAVAARIFFMLPYYRASIRFMQNPRSFMMSLKRTMPTGAEFKGSWKVGERLRDPDVDSLAFFLVERYCLFATDGARLYQTRVYHHPWILDDAQVKIHSSTMIPALGLPEPATQPLIHFSAGVSVEVWPPVETGTAVLPSPTVKISVQ